MEVQINYINYIKSEETSQNARVHMRDLQVYPYFWQTYAPS